MDRVGIKQVIGMKNANISYVARSANKRNGSFDDHGYRSLY